VKSIRRVTVAVLAAATVAGLAAGPAAAAKVVQARGGVEFQPNQYLAQTNRFAPTVVYVRPNGWVRWEDGDKTVEPHTVMAVESSNLPTTVSEIFSCQICSLWHAHLADPNDESSGIARLKVKVGKVGFQREGDSLFLHQKARIAARVNAPIGKTIRYMCAFHPWMQGTIIVTRSGHAPGHAR
jgi:plastocyanin